MLVVDYIQSGVAYPWACRTYEMAFLFGQMVPACFKHKNLDVDLHASQLSLLCFSKAGLVTQPRLGLWLCCLGLLSTRITDMCHYPWPASYFLTIKGKSLQERSGRQQQWEQGDNFLCKEMACSTQVACPQLGGHRTVLSDVLCVQGSGSLSRMAHCILPILTTAAWWQVLLLCSG